MIWSFSLFLTALHTGLLEVLITFAADPFYPSQSQVVQEWGLRALATSNWPDW
jgi:hypothetical protein